MALGMSSCRMLKKSCMLTSNLRSYCVAEQASGRVAAAEAELETLRAHAAAHKALDAEAQRRVSAMKTESAEQVRARNLL